jgi:gas vesicle protein
MTDNRDNRGYDYAGDAFRWLSAGFGLGLLVGGALGLLLAPKAGHETRERLKEFATDFGERAKVVTDDFSDRAKTAASGLGEQAVSTYQSVTGSASSTAEDLSKTAQVVSSSISDGIAMFKDAGTKFQDAVKEGYTKKVDELASDEAPAEEEKPKKRTRKKKTEETAEE